MRFLLVLIISIFFNLPAHAACLNPDGVPGELMYNGNYDVFQGCTLRGWKAFHAPGSFRALPPKDCPNVGNTCDDGTLFAGFHPVTEAILYAMQEDAPTTLSWNKYHGDGTVDEINLPGNNTDTEPMNDCPWVSDYGTHSGTGILSRDPVHPHPLSTDPNKAVVTPGCHEGKRMTIIWRVL